MTKYGDLSAHKLAKYFRLYLLVETRTSISTTVNAVIKYRGLTAVIIGMFGVETRAVRSFSVAGNERWRYLPWTSQRHGRPLPCPVQQRSLSTHSRLCIHINTCIHWHGRSASAWRKTVTRHEWSRDNSHVPLQRPKWNKKITQKFTSTKFFRVWSGAYLLRNAVSHDGAIMHADAYRPCAKHLLGFMSIKGSSLPK